MNICCIFDFIRTVESNMAAAVGCHAVCALCVCCYTVQLWELEARKLVCTFGEHTGPVSAVQFHPSEHMLASGSSDKYATTCWLLYRFICVGCMVP